MVFLILGVFLGAMAVGLYVNLGEKEQEIARVTQQALAGFEAPIVEKKYCTLSNTFSCH